MMITRMFEKPTVTAGDRVTFTMYAHDRNIPNRRQRLHGRAIGTVMKITRRHAVAVLWDGRKTICEYHPAFIEKVNA